MQRSDSLEHRPAVADLLEEVRTGVRELEAENRTLRDEVGSLLRRIETLEAGAVSPDVPLEAFLADLAHRARARAGGASTRPADHEEARHLGVLLSVLDFLAVSVSGTDPTEETGTSLGRDLGVVPRPDPQRAREPEPASDPDAALTPEEVLAGPTSDAPPHRVSFPSVRHQIPGMEGVRYRERGHIHEEGLLERRAPWLIDAVIRLDMERVERFTDRVAEIVGGIAAVLVTPVAPWIEAAGRGLERVLEAIADAFDRVLGLVPMPGWAKALMTGGGSAIGPGEATMQQRLKGGYDSLIWVGLITSTAVHFALFAFWPTLEVDDFSVASDELTAIEMPPEIEIPPPPSQISRPATPVMATDALIDEDVTIEPTTFEDNPVEELPPPPEESDADRGATPTFTPFTVAPRITNGDEVARLVRAEYPPLLRESGVGGQVVVWFYIDEEGRVQDTRVFQSSGYDALDRAALSVADRVRFTPALDGDRRVPVWIQFPLTFQVR